MEAQPKMGSRPDFRIKLKLEDRTEFTYIIEATDIDLESGTALERDQNELSVFDILNEIPSPDFSLFLETRGSVEGESARLLKDRTEFNYIIEAGRCGTAKRPE